MLRHSYLSDLNECAPVVEITQMNQLSVWIIVDGRNTYNVPFISLQISPRL